MDAPTGTAVDFNGLAIHRLPLDSSLLRLAPNELQFFQAQTGIADVDALLAHIHSITHEAYTVYPYPCIRWYTFVKITGVHHPAYPFVLTRGICPSHGGGILIDIGCCFGTDVRAFVQGGYPADKIIAFDIRQELWDLGHRLFKTSSHNFPIEFVQGNIFDLEPYLPSDHSPNSGALQPRIAKTEVSPPPLALKIGQASAVYAGHLFHLFTEGDQRRVARILVGLLSRRPGSIIFGRHRGLSRAGLNRAVPSGISMFCHSPDSWSEMWTEVAGATPVHVEAKLTDLGPSMSDKGVKGEGEELAWDPKCAQAMMDSARWLIWSVEVVSR
ncbi:hypothetical protein C8Q79DRAFT_617841 [Trametes meyenii]|nr:hypothetical protein C8Q79DRAFT_617841 [Trametes meyenii]